MSVNGTGRVIWKDEQGKIVLASTPITEKLITAWKVRKCGRTTKPGQLHLHVACGALTLQQLHDLTDRQAVEAIAFNITWHYALDIRRETDAYLCERTLRNYRHLIIEHELDRVLFRTLTDKLIASVGASTDRQRLDPTAVRSYMWTLTRVGIVVETTSKFLRELKRRCQNLYEQADPEIWREYVDREGEGCFALSKPSELKRRLPEAARNLYDPVCQFRLTKASELESFLILERVFDEQCEVAAERTEDDYVKVKAPKDVPCDGVLNPADPDATYNARRGVGYRVQLMETFSDEEDSEGESEDKGAESDVAKPDLITHVAIGKMTGHDQSALLPALEDTKSRAVGPTSFWLTRTTDPPMVWLRPKVEGPALWLRP